MHLWNDVTKISIRHSTPFTELTENRMTASQVQQTHTYKILMVVVDNNRLSCCRGSLLHNIVITVGVNGADHSRNHLTKQDVPICRSSSVVPNGMH